MDSEAPLERNIVILGRTGTGKKTVVNKLLGEERFQVDSAMTSVTREARNMTVEHKTSEVHYKIKILDTLGPYSSTIDEETILKEIEEYSTGASYKGINLILFTFRHGVYERREIEIFNAICEMYKEEIPNISALVVTGCECIDEEGRKRLIEELNSVTVTREFVQFMKKGIHPVGFPNIKNIKPALRDEYEQGIISDTNSLKGLVLDASELLTMDLESLPRKKRTEKGTWFKFCSLL